jgi:adenylate kinase family enzyme
MTRVAIIGNAGGGKSTLSRKLGQAHSLPVYPIDQIQWRPGWVSVPPDEFARQHDALLAHERWIIDGWGPWDAITTRFEHADTIIVVDHPLAVHYWWAVKRQIKCLFRARPDGPPGCPMLPMTWVLLKLIWQIHRTQRPALLDLVATMSDHARVVHLRSPRQLHRFIRDYC